MLCVYEAIKEEKSSATEKRLRLNSISDDLEDLLSTAAVEGFLEAGRRFNRPTFTVMPTQSQVFGCLIGFEGIEALCKFFQRDFALLLFMIFHNFACCCCHTKELMSSATPCPLSNTLIGLHPNRISRKLLLQADRRCCRRSVSTVVSVSIM